MQSSHCLLIQWSPSRQNAPHLYKSCRVNVYPSVSITSHHSKEHLPYIHKSIPFQGLLFKWPYHPGPIYICRYIAITRNSFWPWDSRSLPEFSGSWNMIQWQDLTFLWCSSDLRIGTWHPWSRRRERGILAPSQHTHSSAQRSSPLHSGRDWKQRWELWKLVSPNGQVHTSSGKTSKIRLNSPLKAFYSAWQVPLLCNFRRVIGHHLGNLCKYDGFILNDEQSPLAPEP